ncbi:hypothetical protein DNFV4_03561 [Nitrospira tepida]|uniref:Uncharacterized protein n=1 Tax=Nitrospira tepida TaxID=2973512 RepID=A0AA86N1L7_9BACT|nr:hypothetical protein DNFV4_03561 [Nitrospira tepida]
MVARSPGRLDSDGHTIQDKFLRVKWDSISDEPDQDPTRVPKAANNSPVR